jgi:membrane protein DedA with SNARE-associated domain
LEGLNPLWLTVAGGVGSSLGELYGYLLGYYGRAAISEKQQRKMEYMIKIFDYYGPITIFLFALTPLPDDLLFIPLGMMRYKITKAFIPSILGKTMMSAILAYGGRTFGTLLRSLFGQSTPTLSGITTIITTIALILIIVAMIKLDWEKIFEKYIGVDRETGDS